MGDGVRRVQESTSGVSFESRFATCQSESQAHQPPTRALNEGALDARAPPSLQAPGVLRLAWARHAHAHGSPPRLTASRARRGPGRRELPYMGIGRRGARSGGARRVESQRRYIGCIAPPAPARRRSRRAIRLRVRGDTRGGNCWVWCHAGR